MKKVKLPNPVGTAGPSGATRKRPDAPRKKLPTPAKRVAGKVAIRSEATKVRTTARPARRVAKRVKGGKGAKPPAVSGAPALAIRELDPVRICGDRTSVTKLFRVDEENSSAGKAAGSRQVHLVFNDRHGWYCEHGRSCHAVSAVMRHAGIR